ncbi:MAG: hypothetical protein ACXWAA_16150, partial [Methylobacter sp.]
LFESGLSHPKASYFLLLRQKKVTKEKAARLPLISCAPRFYRGSAEGAPAPLLTCGIPAAPLNGLFSIKAPVLGAANGTLSVPR